MLLQTFSIWILKKLHSAGFRCNLPIAIKLFLNYSYFKLYINGAYFEFSRYEGVPQGRVLSTTLFILAINELVSQLPSRAQCYLNVDDFAI